MKACPFAAVSIGIMLTGAAYGESAIPQPVDKPPHADGTKLTKSAVRDLVEALGDPSNEVRAQAAEALRPLLAADPSIRTNWHDKSFWTQRIEKTKPDTTLDDALAILLPELSAAERKKRNEGGEWSGGTGFEVCRLDDYWWAGFQLKDFDKKLLIERPKLEPHVQQVWVKPPDHFTGLWVTWRSTAKKRTRASTVTASATAHLPPSTTTVARLTFNTLSKV